ncbi:Rad4-domain-containing protein, partial [Aureobasidium melanogenum]|uniref:Rad4-domain-containing protein n=1 Tax=Aureobasidium melanogenum (strain CBS 110374) TaxID=1043003 RepID=A0A074VNT4_AURM1
MPPFVPRKRRSPSPEAPPAKRRETARGKKAPVDKKPTKPTKPKSSVFDAIDTLNTKATAEEAKNFFASVGKGDSDDDDDDDASSSDDDDHDFEDVPMNQAPKEQDDGEDIDWEDAIPAQEDKVDDDSAIQDINISINEDGSVQAIAAAEQQAKAKKGPSKRERQARIRAHCIHVQTLLFHNAVRNSWLNDAELHKILLDSLSQGVKDEIDRWKINMGMKQPPPKKKQKGKTKGNSKGRDWGQDADRLEPGVPNLSSGDPLLRLLKVLTAYWKKRFNVTAPGIRKQGYLPQRLITYEIKAWAKNKSNFERHGERIENIDEFRKCAKECRGSRDVGAQLFTALIRAIGIESRMVASLQPTGFGWTKVEEGEIKKQPQTTSTNPVEISDDESDLAESLKPKSKAKAKKPLKTEKPARKSARKSQNAVVEDESSDLSSVPSDADEDDDASVIDITPAPPVKNSKKYDRDLAFPHYWTEVLSPVSNTYIPVDSIVLSTVASNQELLSTFEPRGKRADQAKQVICYVVAHNQDTTCKDVTVRYLKKHQLPGRTKGFRMPVEKIPVLNKRGKVIKTEDYDFFKRIMSPFVRPHNKRTAADDIEESTDLKPFKPATEKAKVATESLQWYKQSAEFVLERHLRREEAILPNAKQVRTFTSGKGDKEKSEPVYRRADVVNCKTVESWHKEGRQIKLGEQPLKMVPVRAVTLMRKREMEEAERETGEKLKQGLYGIDQTEWIIPPPIENGVIPKNAYNNIDVYVPSMVPKGAVHIPLRSTARICRKLNIDYAEACTGFEFGKQRAVPIITGVVVAVENEDAVIDAWEVEEAERKRKEDVKRQATNLHLWRKFLMGLRIVERIRSDYAGRPNEIDEVNPFVNRDKQKKKKAPRDEMTEGGGFLVSEDEEDHKSKETKEEDTDLSLGGGGFVPEDEDEDEDDTKAEDADIEMGGGFLLDDDDAEEEKKPVTSSHFAPMSLSAASRQIQSSDAEPVKDEEESEEEMDAEEVPPQRPNPRTSTATAKSKAKPKAAPRAKTKAAPKPPPKRPARKSKAVLSESEEEDENEDDEEAHSSSLSDLTDASEDSAPSKPFKRRTSSPRVIISPRKKNGIKKEIKSPYFSHTEDDGGEEMEEDEESEEEVVKPRQTTRRTRGKG